jgi:hypothetical protein
VPADAPVVGLVTWHDATTGRPDGIVMTDAGPGEHLGGDHWYHAGTSDIMDPQPSLWCDPVPPAAGPHGTLTVEDVESASVACESAAESAFGDGNHATGNDWLDLARRLSEALPKEGT